jgi:preprotein translocase subunit SecD
MECDAARNVYLLNSPLVTGGIASAKPQAIAGGPQWYVRVTFDEAAASTISQTVDAGVGGDLAVVLNGQVLTAVIVDSSMKDGHIGITGDYDKASATELADQLSA